VWQALHFPGRHNAYVTYNAQRAQGPHVARRFRSFLADAGIAADGTLSDVVLPKGGSVAFRGVEGGLTGLPVDGLCVLDDLVKDYKDCSKSRLELILDQYRSAIEPRVHPGASIVVMATRWHPDDLSGVLSREGWEIINLPAMAEENDPNGRQVGEPLFPQHWPLQELEKKRAATTEFFWQALYQGHPRPPGGKVFREASWYTELPKVYRGIYGLDLAYTAKTSADWSVCVTLYREDRDEQDPLYYVVHVDRAQVEAPDFAVTLRARNVQRPGFKMIWRASGTEKGAAQFLVKAKLPVIVKNPPGDKLVSATGVAAAWNQGRVLLPDPDVFPDEQAWVMPFLDIVQNFTGTGKEHDDDVDALGNAHDTLDRRERPEPVIASIG